MATPSTLRKFQHKVLQALGLRPLPAWPLDNDSDAPKMMDQLQSPLFRLSAELRIPIYVDVLGDEERFLHICVNNFKWAKRDNMKRRQLAHWRCTDPESEYWTFQHRCYGEEPFENDGRRCNVERRNFTETEDQLIGLLLSCRRVYSESLRILYELNYFHFRGGLSLPAFKRSVPIAQWNAIRKIHISTAYSPFYWPTMITRGLVLPGMLPNWNLICEDLSSMPNLQTLSFDICADDPWFRTYDFSLTATETLLKILRPIKAIRARTIVVELNVELSREVMQLLGPVEFEIVYRERLYNNGFANYPLLDSIELKGRYRTQFL